MRPWAIHEDVHLAEALTMPIEKVKERPILFSAPMVRAILEGRKTQTRIPLNPKDKIWEPGAGINTCPYGKPGDRLVPAMQIPGVDKRYCADVYGRIWSKARTGEWVVLKPYKGTKGYQILSVGIAGTWPVKHVHALVCSAFYGQRPSSKHQVRHIDGNPSNNAVENLDWCLQSENWTDRDRGGKGVRADHWAAKLDEQRVADIRTKRVSQRAFASLYGISQSNVCDIQAGRTWKKPTEAAPCSDRWASRILLEITDVRVDRLQEISEEDATAEGMSLDNFLSGEMGVDWFRKLWDTIHKPDSPNGWNANPWVWVITFKRLTL